MKKKHMNSLKPNFHFGEMRKRWRKKKPNNKKKEKKNKKRIMFFLIPFFLVNLFPFVSFIFFFYFSFFVSLSRPDPTDNDARRIQFTWMSFNLFLLGSPGTDDNFSSFLLVFILRMRTCMRVSFEDTFSYVRTGDLLSRSIGTWAQSRQWHLSEMLVYKSISNNLNMKNIRDFSFCFFNL